MAVEFRLLGHMEVRVAGRVVDIGHDRQRCVLVALLVDANRPVPVGELIERVWAGRPPRHAHNALAGYLSRLRRILPPADVTIERRSRSCVLIVDPATVDLHRFEELAGNDQLAEALALWRGEAFDGLDTPWLGSVRVTLGQRRLEVELARNDLELRRGHHAELLTGLTTCAATHPLNERLIGQLMVALYRCGRQADALETYHQLRLQLGEELGADPSPPLRRLHRDILTANPVLASPRPPPAAAIHAGNLPTELTSFIGRCGEMASLTRLLSTARLVTLTGVGGVGKTRLSLRAATNLRPAFPDGAWFVELAEVTDPALVAQIVADALDVRDISTRTPINVLTEFLRYRRLLLILDNAEHLLDACAELASAVLDAAEGVRVLVTSRQPLRVAGEHVHTVAPLEEADREALFADRAAAVLPGEFAITPANRETVALLCQRLDGIPLAIELAAARLRTTSVDQLLARLDDRFRLLTGGYRTALPRQHTLLATVDWSFDLCSPAEQRLWARASVFAGSFGLDAAEGVCAGAGITRDDVLYLLDGLVDKSVLTVEQQQDGVRYRLLETMRHYGQHRLREFAEDAEVCGRYAGWYLRFAERGEAEWFGPNQLAWFTAMRREHANLRAAFEYCLRTPGAAGAGLAMAAALCFYWVACGFVREGRYWLDRALELGPEPRRTRAKALWVNGWIAITQGEVTTGLLMLTECRNLASRLGDAAALAHAEHKLGLATLFGGDLPAGVAMMEQALAQLKQLGQPDNSVLMAQVQLAMTSSLRGDVDRAAELAQQARLTCLAHGEHWVASGALYALARVEWRRGRLGLAAFNAGESLRIKYRLNDLVGIALVVEQLAWIAAAASDEKRAAVLLGVADRMWPAVGLPLFGSKYHLAAHDECVDRAREGLGDPAFYDAFRYGNQLTLDEARAYALND